MLPADSHVHTEWSWDTDVGSMEQSCARAVGLGIPAIAFTEHLDHTVWTVALESLEKDDTVARLADPDGKFTPPRFDAAGYLESIERCRDRYPELQILSGLELGEPHRHADRIADVLSMGTFDRILGSLHCLPDGHEYADPPGLFARRDPEEVLRSYLAEVARLVTRSDTFAVLAHIDYPIRYWPEHARPFDPVHFEEEFRHALRTLAEGGRALEINTKIPLHSLILRWWHDLGGEAVTFGSDAHLPSAVAWGFGDAAQMAEAHGFRPGRPGDFWGRTD